MSPDPTTVDGAQAGIYLEARLRQNGGDGRFPLVTKLFLFRGDAGLDEYLIGLRRFE